MKNIKTLLRVNNKNLIDCQMGGKFGGCVKKGKVLRSTN